MTLRRETHAVFKPGQQALFLLTFLLHLHPPAPASSRPAGPATPTVHLRFDAAACQARPVAPPRCLHRRSLPAPAIVFSLGGRCIHVAFWFCPTKRTLDRQNSFTTPNHLHNPSAHRSFSPPLPHPPTRLHPTKAACPLATLASGSAALLHNRAASRSLSPSTPPHLPTPPESFVAPFA